MLRPAAALVLALVSWLGPSPVAAQRCDPYSSSVEAPIPRALQLRTTCGNGRIDTYAVSCTRHESGGCGHPHQTSTTCERTQELCDGGALAGASCVGLGYAGGTVRCAQTCDRLELDRCTLCAAPGTCRERSVGYLEYQDVTLVAQGATIRAYWYDDTDFYAATVDDRGALGTPKVLAPMGSFRMIPVRVGSSAVVLGGPMEKPELVIARANGTVARVPLPGQRGSWHMPVVPIEGKDHALVLVGDHVVVVDAAGATRPAAAGYGQNAYRRAALVPIPKGLHVLRWSTLEADIDAQPGDVLLVHHDYKTHVSLLRGGQEVPAKAYRTVPGAESADVALDGSVLAAFGTAEDVIAGVKHARTPKPAPSVKLLGPRAYDHEVSIVRTATREVHAARVPHGDSVEMPRSTLAIAVRVLAP